jgi:hypothetical protein
MRIPPQHAQVLVPGDARDFHDVQTLLEKPRSRLVAQVVETQVFYVGPRRVARIQERFVCNGWPAGQDVPMPRSPGMGESGPLSEPGRDRSLSPTVVVDAAFLAETGLSVGPLEPTGWLIDQSLVIQLCLS